MFNERHYDNKEAEKGKRINIKRKPLFLLVPFGRTRRVFFFILHIILEKKMNA